jgi:hypothetical protein
VSKKRFKLRRKKSHPLQMQEETKLVAVLTPCDDVVRTHYHMSMVKMLEHTYTNLPASLRGLYMNTLSGSILPQSRQALANLALENGATHLLWIDSDMSFPKDMLLRFLQRDEKIIGINAVTRRPPHLSCAQYDDGSFVKTSRDSQGLEKIGRTGFGVLWAAAEVFAAMPKPYFQFPWDEKLQDFRGEDMYFFDQANKLGFEAYIDHNLSKEIMHFGSYGFNPLMLEQPDEQQAEG